MKPQFTLTLAVTLTLWTLTLAQMSLVPSREYGFVYKGGHSDAPVKVAAFLDLTCPDSQEVYPTLTEVADQLGPSSVQLKVHLFSLPYHRNSHTISKGAHVIAGFKSPKNATVYDWFSSVYANIGRLTTSATAELNDGQVLDVLAPMAKDVAGIPEGQFKDKVADSSIDGATRAEWKYGCTRGVYGTPMFTVNDVFVEASQWTVQQWKAYIKQLIAFC